MSHRLSSSGAIDGTAALCRPSVSTAVSHIFRYNVFPHGPHKLSHSELPQFAGQYHSGPCLSRFLWPWMSSATNHGVWISVLAFCLPFPQAGGHALCPQELPFPTTAGRRRRRPGIVALTVREQPALRWCQGPNLQQRLQHSEGISVTMEKKGGKP